MTRLLKPYRILATVVGVLLVPLVLLAWPRHLFYTEGGAMYELGETINQTIGPLHGFVYMFFLIVAFLLSREARWSVPFTVSTLLLGTVPVLSFWAEHRATNDVRARIAAQREAVPAGR